LRQSLDDEGRRPMRLALATNLNSADQAEQSFRAQGSERMLRESPVLVDLGGGWFDDLGDNLL
jgi:hypothetical protein